MSDTPPTIPQIADTIAEVVTETPQPARDFLEELNKKLQTDYRDTRSIGRGLKHAVEEGLVVRSGPQSRPLYSKRSA